MLGDSSTVFMDLLPLLETNTVFFLDGHWSAGNTGRGIKDCPLYEEISCINEKFKHRAVIIVDDTRLFGKGPNNGTDICNWEDINVQKILQLLDRRIIEYSFMPSILDNNDRMIIMIDNASD
jgi:hypothetical protein